MAYTQQQGFTIVEISLFIAITGLLFLIAVLGTGSTIRAMRYTDSNRSLESFVKLQYDNIINGLNNRNNQISCANGTVSTTSGQELGTSNCLLMGRLIVFRQNSPDVVVYNVVGSEPASVNYTLSDEQLITAFQPRTVTNAATSTYTIPWGASPSGFKRLSDNLATNGLLLIRSPKSTRVVSYTFRVASVVLTDLSVVVSTSANISKQVNFCIKSADSIDNSARLFIDGGGSQSAVSLIFNTTVTDCNGT